MAAVRAGSWVEAVLLVVFWYPFDFRTDGAFIKSRLDFLQRVPFEVYYFGTEFRAITEVLRKTLFFAPLGGLLAWGVVRQPWRWRGTLFVVAMLVLVLMPAFIELGQVMLPEKIADTTDWMLAWLGGLSGYGVARRVLRAPRHMATPRVQTIEPSLRALQRICAGICHWFWRHEYVVLGRGLCPLHAIQRTRTAATG